VLFEFPRAAALAAAARMAGRSGNENKLFSVSSQTPAKETDVALMRFCGRA
jgi:hypothetical protein